MFSSRQFLPARSGDPEHMLASDTRGHEESSAHQDLDYVTENGTERCCVCGTDTQVPASLPIEMRSGYVEGVGQLCLRCR